MKHTYAPSHKNAQPEVERQTICCDFVSSFEQKNGIEFKLLS